jgi:hypothetical protein
MHPQAALLMGLFAGRNDLYTIYRLAKRRKDGKRKKDPQSIRVVREPITVELWAEHLKGTRPIGIVPIRPEDGCVVWGCLDVDRGYLENPFEYWIPLLKKIWEEKLPFITFFSPSGGLHCYLLLKEWTEASEVIHALHSLSGILGPGRAEIFPKQTKVEEEGVGNWVAMPLWGNNQPCVRWDPLNKRIEELPLVDATVLMQNSQIKLDDLDLDAYGKTAKQGVPDKWPKGPYCLNHIIAEHNGTVPVGMRNTFALNYAIFAYRERGQSGLKDLKDELNELCAPEPDGSPAIDETAFRNIVKAASEIEYNYQCKTEPLISHCNRIICMARPYGIGNAGEALPLPGTFTLKEGDPHTARFMVSGFDEEVCCTINTLLNWTKFKEFILMATRGVMPSSDIKTGTWTVMISEMLKEPPPSFEHADFFTTPPGEVVTYFKNWAGKRKEAENKEDLLRGLIWHQNGLLYFKWEHFAKELDRLRFTKLTKNQCIEVLKKHVAAERCSLRINENLVIKCYKLPDFESEDCPLNVPKDITKPPPL